MNNLYRLLFLLLFANQLQSQDTLSVLFLGNSYTSFNNLPQLVQSISGSAGKTLIVDFNLPGGMTISGHLNDATSVAKISQGTWDYIVVQEQSQVPTIDYYRYNDMYPALGDLKMVAEQYNPCVKIISYMTWGRRFGGQQCDPNNTYCSPVFSDFNHMQDSLTSAYMGISNLLGIQCAPVGVTWKNILNDSNLVLHSNDNSHPNLEGSYVAALSIFSAIWKIPSSGLIYTAGISAGRAQYYQTITDATVFNSPDDWNLNINKPTANFNFTPAGNDVNFSNLSVSQTNASLSYSWDFGDGSSSILENPQHSYSGSGVYNVTLIVSDCIFSDTVSYSVQVGASGVSSGMEPIFQVFPNPVKDIFVINSRTSGNIAYFELYDLLGKKQKSGEIVSESTYVDIGELVPGIYILRFNGSENESVKILKE